jgi:hypothetical protein
MIGLRRVALLALLVSNGLRLSSTGAELDHHQTARENGRR